MSASIFLPPRSPWGKGGKPTNHRYKKRHAFALDVIAQPIFNFAISRSSSDFLLTEADPRGPYDPTIENPPAFPITTS